MFTDKTRWRNAGLWLSIMAYIPALCTMFQLNITQFQGIEGGVKALISILVILGILNNPISGKGFSDQQEVK